ncbi:MAG: hypothetical protein J7J10_00715 [Deltaproteobacteria bacterium]|nr:hypothetical protein [Deltaproteobacteria bacterium]
MIFLYNLFIVLALLLASPFLIYKIFVNKRWRYRVKERFLPKKIKKDNFFLLHASSLGEINASKVLIDELKKRFSLDVVVTTFTDTGFKRAKQLYSSVYFLPLDIFFLYSVMFYNKPRFAVLFETELWPSLVYFLKAHHIPIFIVNGRMSKRSFKWYRFFSFFFKPVLQMFDAIFVRSEDDKSRFLKLTDGRGIIKVCGNIKGFPPVEETKEVDLSPQYDVITFGSIHAGELDIIIPVVKKLINKKRMIVVAPRHLEKLSLFEKRLKEENIDYRRRTEKKWGNTILLDTYGELVSFYKNSKAVFIGGSLIPNIGGHNPIEGLLSERKVIFGPFMDNFKEEVDRIIRMGLGSYVYSGEELAEKMEEVLQEKNGKNEGFFDYYKNVLSCYVDGIEKLLMSDEKNL